MSDVTVWSDGSTMCDGSAILWRPRPATFSIGRPLVFRTPPGIGVEAHARTYRLGAALVAHVLPYYGGATVTLTDWQHRDALVTHWTPESGFTPDPGRWINERDPYRRLACGSAGHTVLEMIELLVGLVRERVDAIPQEIAELEHAEMRRQHLATWSED